MTPQDEWLKNQILKDTLAAFRTGCDEKNYKILKLLPTTIENLQVELDTKGVKTVNTRVNALEEVGLVIRSRGTGQVEESGMTQPFLTIIDQVALLTEKNVPKYMESNDLL